MNSKPEIGDILEEINNIVHRIKKLVDENNPRNDYRWMIGNTEVDLRNTVESIRKQNLHDISFKTVVKQISQDIWNIFSSVITPILAIRCIFIKFVSSTYELPLPNRTDLLKELAISIFSKFGWISTLGVASVAVSGALYLGITFRKYKKSRQATYDRALFSAVTPILSPMNEHVNINYRENENFQQLLACTSLRDHNIPTNNFIEVINAISQIRITDEFKNCFNKINPPPESSDMKLIWDKVRERINSKKSSSYEQPCENRKIEEWVGPYFKRWLEAFKSKKKSHRKSLAIFKQCTKRYVCAETLIQHEFLHIYDPQIPKSYYKKKGWCFVLFGDIDYFKIIGVSKTGRKIDENVHIDTLFSNLGTKNILFNLNNLLNKLLSC